jgi:hypothetical protein
LELPDTFYLDESGSGFDWIRCHFRGGVCEEYGFWTNIPVQTPANRRKMEKRTQLLAVPAPGGVCGLQQQTDNYNQPLEHFVPQSTARMKCFISLVLTI